MRVIASQKLPRESIFAARHQDVSQSPLGNPLFPVLGILTRVPSGPIEVNRCLAAKITPQ